MTALSENVLSVLKSFSSINQSIVIKPGDKLRTISNQKTIMAEANLDMKFDSTAAVYDLARFLATVSLFEKPDLTFNEKTIAIAEGKKRVNYTLAEPSMIVQPPENVINMPACEVEVDLSWSNVNEVLKAAAVLQLPEVSFTGKDGEVTLEALDSKNPTTDRYGVSVGETENNFNFFIKVENLKLMQADYKVSLSSSGLSTFVNENVSYWIAVESKSNFGG